MSYKINDDDSQSVSYTTQGELITNKFSQCKQKWFPYVDNYISYSNNDINSINGDSLSSWKTQIGKYVNLIEPDNPWHIIKMNNHLTENSIDNNIDSFNNIPNVPNVPNVQKEEIVEKKSIIDFNTIMCSLIFLIIFLIIIRYYYFST